MARKALQFLQSIAGEVLVLLALICCINLYLGKPDSIINGDGMGYYDYLPSLFIHKDLDRHVEPKDSLAEYQRLKDYQFRYVYVPYQNQLINKYAIGTALLESPFFFYTLWDSDIEKDQLTGYEAPFQTAVYYSTLFYLFLSLYLLKGLLLLYKLRHSTIFLCQILLVLATPIVFYSGVEPAYSHIYSLFGITLLLFSTKAYIQQGNRSQLLWFFASLGLVFLLRPANLLILFALPFLAKSPSQLQQRVRQMFSQVKVIALGLVLFLVFVFLQMLVWHAQVGEWLVYSYPGESFDFANPHFIDILFSYKKGLFIYTPLILIALISSIWLFLSGKRFQFIIYIVFFTGITYFLSSWWSWYFGCSFGLRAYIDFFSFLMLPFALALDQLKLPMKSLILSVALLTIPLNLIQIYQYKYYILHWENMDQERYWKVFLKTDLKYGGLFWKNELVDSYTLEKEFSFDEKIVVNPTVELLFDLPTDSIPNFDRLSFIKVMAQDDFKEAGHSHFTLAINEGEKNIYWHEINTILLSDKPFGEMQTGYFPFEFNIGPSDSLRTIRLSLHSNSGSDTLRNIRVQFLRRNW